MVGPADPALWLVRERGREQIERTQWMLRVVDARAAIAARGFPVAVTADVPLAVEDRQLPANSGSWRLRVADGDGRLEATAQRDEAVRLDIGALGALYGGVPTATLRRAGRLAGRPDLDPVLDAVFSASPFTLDFF
jgi:predicted acetyltransferase